MMLVVLLLDDLERPMLHMEGDGRVFHFATEKTLRIKHGVHRVPGSLVLSSITNQALRFRERNARWGSAIAMVISNDLNTLVLPDTDARVCGTQIDTNGGPINVLRETGTRIRYLSWKGGAS
jgi:hypothetical protein